ncbi:DUF6515 family protein [Niabella beijingensis]|uniref:DUF6515 family protein n=1 Tax=Niabella beijingensis TaxID=2872700 RepID=UPI001CBB1D5B|nr:DUF6515 family protein [Niabella beijingensis]MBZ4188191.1 DUF6515 family protein [Niabella beijingensis]
MNSNFIKFGMFLLGASLLLAIDSFGQYRRYPQRVYRSYHYHRAPRVSVGIGGVFGWPAPYYRYGYGPNVGVSVGIALPPIGATIYALPPGSRRVYYGGVPYYYRNNTYYTERDKGRYEVVAPPLGATSERLPNGARMRKIDGTTYYEYNGTYYKPDLDDNGDRIYVVVGRNGELNTGDAASATRSDNAYPGDYENNDGDETDAEAPYDAADAAGDTDDTTTGNAYYNHPQVGDQFDQLPKNSQAVTVDGKKQYRSPAGTYYKEVTIEGKLLYEVVRSK